MGDGRQYRCGRDFAAAVGSVARLFRKRWRKILVRISKCGDKKLTRLPPAQSRQFLLL
jgi:hypothetical protein